MWYTIWLLPGISLAEKQLVYASTDSSAFTATSAGPLPVVTLSLGGTSTLSTNLSIGTPPQNITMSLISSSDILFGEKFDFCEEFELDCNKFFNPNLSSTWVADGTSSQSGFYSKRILFGSDDLIIGDQNISDVEVAYTYGNTSSTWYSTNSLGFGPLGGELSVVSYYGNQFIGAYQTLPIILKNRGITESATWSFGIHTDTSDTIFGYDMARSAEIAFGNIDKMRFKPPFTVVPIVNAASSDFEAQVDNFPSSAPPQSLNIIMHGVAVRHFPDGESHFVGNLSLPTSIQFSTGLSLPNDLVEALMNQLGFLASDYLDEWLVPCDTSASIQLDFSGMVVDVPFQKLLTPINVELNTSDSSAAMRAAESLNSSHICGVSFLPGEPPAIGLEILDSLYTVFDLDSNEVYFAPVADDWQTDTPPNWELVPANGIQNATRALSYSSTQFVLPYTISDSTESQQLGVGTSIIEALTLEGKLWSEYVSYASDVLRSPSSIVTTTADSRPTSASSASSTGSKNLAGRRDVIWNVPLWISWLTVYNLI